MVFVCVDVICYEKSDIFYLGLGLFIVDFIVNFYCGIFNISNVFDFSGVEVIFIFFILK